MGWEIRVVKRIWNHKYFHEPREIYEIKQVYIDNDGRIVKIEENSFIFENTLEELKFSLKECFEKSIIEERVVNGHPPPS